MLTLFAVISTIIALYASVPYIRAIFNGRTKPHQFSWLIFVILNAITFLSQFLEGARLSVFISFGFLLGSIVIFLLSLKYGTRDTSRWDRLLFSFAIVTIVIWIITKSNVAAIWLTVLIDAAATTMLILKVRALPKSEAPLPWILASTGYVFSCLTLIRTPFGILYTRPISNLIGDLLIVFAIYYYMRKNSKA